MKNKIFAVVCLLLAGMILMPCYGQNRNRRKNKEPEVPKLALLPNVSKTHFEKQTDKYLDWVDSLADAPATVREYTSNLRKYQHMSPGVIKQHVLEFKALAQHPDLEEVMQHSRSWYFKMYNASLPLIQASELIHGMRSMPVPQKYISARAMLHKAMNNILDISETKPQRLTRDQLIQITNKNRERRKKEWLKWYYADQKRKAQEAKKAPAVKDKKNNKSSRRQKKESAR